VLNSPVFPDRAIAWPALTKSPWAESPNELCLYTLVRLKECSIIKTNPVSIVHSEKTTLPSEIALTGVFVFAGISTP